MSTSGAPKTEKSLDERRKRRQYWHDIMVKERATLSPENQAKVQVPERPSDDARSQDLDEFDEKLEESFYRQKMKLLRNREVIEHADEAARRKELNAFFDDLEAETCSSVSSSAGSFTEETKTESEALLPSKDEKPETKLSAPKSSNSSLIKWLVAILGLAVLVTFIVIAVRWDELSNEEDVPVAAEAAEEPSIEEVRVDFNQRFKERRGLIQEELSLTNKAYYEEK